MMNALHVAALAAAALVLQGCAGAHWTKPGADQAAVSRDMDECRGVALGRAGPPVSAARSTDAVTDRRPAMGAPTAGSNERFVAEQEEIRRCMLNRGYQLRRD